MESSTVAAPADWIELLAHTPLFGMFGEDERAEIAGALVERVYHRGDTVCEVGDEGDTLFVCASGQLDVWGEAPRRVINRLGPGDCFGEMSLLLGDKRTATVTAARATRLLALDRKGFDRFFLGSPKALAYLARLLAQRLAAITRGDSVARRCTTVAVVGAEAPRGKTLVAAALTALLASMTGRSAVLVRLRKLGTHGQAPTLQELLRRPTERIRAGIDRSDGGLATLAVTVAGVESARAELLSELVDRLDEEFSFVVLDLEGVLAPIRRRVEGVAHFVIEVVTRCEPASGVDGESRRLRVVNLHDPQTLALQISSCDPYVLRTDVSLQGLRPGAQAAHVVANPRSPTGPALHRLARKILGTTVGLVLGGGAAFGIAHLGVLKVLEDHGIPIDVLVGCSMGSIVALGYAGGYRAGELIDIATRLGNVGNTLWVGTDLTLTRPALLSGDRMIGLFRPFYAHYQRFEELTLPCRIVATDIESGERVAIGHGDVETAARASAAVPMLWPPVRRDGRILVDGGVADPVPAEVAREMGADVCLAVNVVPPLRPGVETVLTSTYRRLRNVDPLSYLSGTRGMPSMVDLVMSSLQTLQHELGDFKAMSADVRMNPDLSDLTWIEFYRPQEFIARGARAAELALPRIRRVLAERLAATCPVSATDTVPAVGS